MDRGHADFTLIGFIIPTALAVAALLDVANLPYVVAVPVGVLIGVVVWLGFMYSPLPKDNYSKNHGMYWGWTDPERDREEQGELPDFTP